MPEAVPRGLGLDFGSGGVRLFAAEGESGRLLLDDVKIPLPWEVMATGERSASPEPLQCLPWAVWSLKREIGRDRLPGSSRGAPAHETAASLLRQVRQRAEAELDAAVTGVAASLPPCLSDRQRTAFRHALEQAGFQKVALLDDPRAALHRHLASQPTAGACLVYGLGEGCFFTTVLNTTAGSCVLSHNGEARLGGRDLDNLLAYAVLRRRVTRGVRITYQEAAALLQAAEACKQQLSTASQAEFRFNQVIGGSCESFCVPVQRDEFESLIRETITWTIEMARRTVTEAGLSLSQVTRVLLVGECTQISLVRRELSALFQCEPEILDPGTVAEGAARFAVERLDPCWDPSRRPAPAPVPTMAEAFGISSSASPPRNPPAPPPPARVDAPGQSPLVLPDPLAAAWRGYEVAAAAENFEQAVTELKSFLRAAGDHLATVYLQAGARLEASGRLEVAARLLEEGLRACPESPPLKIKLCVVFVALSDNWYASFTKERTLGEQVHCLDRSIDYLSQVLRIDPHHALAIQRKKERQRLKADLRTRRRR